jgi:plasmid maintenance system killer protein
MKKSTYGKPPTDSVNAHIMDIEPASARSAVTKTNKKHSKKPKSWGSVRFKDKKLQKMYETEEGTHKYSEAIVENFFEKMEMLAMANNEQDLHNFSSLGFHKLKKGKLKEQYAVRLTGNWRLTMKIEEDTDSRYLLILEIVDYH